MQRCLDGMSQPGNFQHSHIAALTLRTYMVALKKTSALRAQGPLSRPPGAQGPVHVGPKGSPPGAPRGRRYPWGWYQGEVLLEVYQITSKT